MFVYQQTQIYVAVPLIVWWA